MAVWRERSGPAARWSGLLLLTMGVCASAGAQEGVTIKRDLRAVRLSTPPVIDGDLSDPCWQQAAKADRFVDVLYSTPVADQTVAYLGYDDNNIYVAFYAYDSQPSGIVARETKRGTRFTGDDDFVAIAIDPFHTHKFVDRSFFIVNPRGTQFARLSGQRATKKSSPTRLPGGPSLPRLITTLTLANGC